MHAHPSLDRAVPAGRTCGGNSPAKRPQRSACASRTGARGLSVARGCSRSGTWIFDTSKRERRCVPGNTGKPVPRGLRKPRTSDYRLDPPTSMPCSTAVHWRDTWLSERHQSSWGSVFGFPSYMKPVQYFVLCVCRKACVLQVQCTSQVGPDNVAVLRIV